MLMIMMVLVFMLVLMLMIMMVFMLMFMLMLIFMLVVTVSYLRLSTSPVFYTSNRETLSAFPLGSVLTFTVHFHDSSGEALHSHNSQLTFSTNRDDLVQVGKGVSNGSLTVSTVNVGLTLLSVWDSEQSSLVDYVALPVHHAIQPADAHNLVPADVVCFSVQLFSHEGLSGTWSSSSSAILEIHPKTGVAVARDVGTVTVYYEIPGQLRTYREVIVNSISRTVAMVPSDSLRNERETKVHLTTRERGTNLIGSCSLTQLESIASLQPEKSISCHLQFTSDAVDFSAHDVYHTHTTFDTSTGVYSCALTLGPLTEQQVKVLGMSMSSVRVEADVEGSRFSGERVSAELQVNPGFYADQTHLILSSQHTTAELSVFGATGLLQHLQVKSSSPSILVQEKEVSSTYPSFIRYTVTLLNLRDITSASLTVWSPSSTRQLLIPITVVNAADTSSTTRGMAGAEGVGILQQFMDSYQVMFFTLFAVLAGTAVIVIVCHAIFSPRDPPVHPAFIQKTPPPPVSPVSGRFNQTLHSSDLRSSPKLRLFSPDYNSR
ncbi:hypothetical protein QTP86_026924 [Hemibagrus guttatus]|nr:hypothetical protein QTP86_026924 [Hemibagrus guttatus]